MAYTSRALAKNWQYDYEGDNFDARVGRLLAGGHRMQDTYQTTGKAQHGVKNPAEDTLQSDGQELGHSKRSNPRSSSPPSGMVWVTSDGTVAKTRSVDMSTTAECSGRQGTASPHDTAAPAVAPADRSMNIWKRISPGMLPNTSKTPSSTATEAFGTTAAYKQPPPDDTFHLKKTDFSEYMETKCRLMHHIKAAKK